MSVTELNIQLAHALGVSDVSTVRKIVLTVEAGRVPSVAVYSSVLSADGMKTIADHFSLNPNPSEVAV